MKMKTFSVILLICTIMLPFSANADTLYLNGVNGRIDSTGSAYIDPYYGGLNNPTGMNNIYCVDPDHNSYLGTNWAVNVTPLTSSLANTYLGLTALTRYEEIAYLIFYTSFGTPSESLSEQQAIQAAIWKIADPSSPYGYSNTWVTNAQNNYSGKDYSFVDILTPTNTKNQEFMTKVPEPSVILLLGSGLVGLWGFRRRFRN